MKKAFAIIVILFAVVLSGAVFVADSCAEESANGKGDKSITLVEEIALDSYDLLIYTGRSMKLNASVYPEDATDKTVEWESTNPTIATVNNGYITAIAPGECDILCRSKDEGKTQAVCHISVRIELRQLVPDQSRVVLTDKGVNTKGAIELTIKPENAYYNYIAWSSSDESIVSVDENGNITAHQPGRARITATPDVNETIHANIDVTVNKTIDSITFEPDTVIIEKGRSARANPIIEPSDAADKKLQWYSNNHDVAVVDEYGNIKAVTNGIAVITASAKDTGLVSKSFVVRVITMVRRFDVLDRELHLPPGMQWRVRYVIEPEDSSIQDIIWKSSDDSIATMKDDGIIVARKPGKCKFEGVTTDGSNIKRTVTVIVGYDKKTGAGLQWGCSMKDAEDLINSIVSDNVSYSEKKYETTVAISCPLEFGKYRIISIKLHFTKTKDKDGSILAEPEKCVLYKATIIFERKEDDMIPEIYSEAKKVYGVNLKKLASKVRCETSGENALEFIWSPGEKTNKQLINK